MTLSGKDQAMVLAAQPLSDHHAGSQPWDQEDIYGAMAVYKAIKPKDTNNDKVFLVIGPWHNGDAVRRRIEIQRRHRSLFPAGYH